MAKEGGDEVGVTPAASAGSGNGIPYSKTNSREQDKLLLEPFTYILQVPGKNIRKKLLAAFNAWFHVEEKKGTKKGFL